MKDIWKVSEKYESGRAGGCAIGMTRGDPGGASYGKYQLASRTGTLKHFLSSSEHGKYFKGLTPGTKRFNAEWKRWCHNEDFQNEQREYIKRTHYEPVRKYADYLGIPRTYAINSAIWSIGVQHGKAKKVLKDANIQKDWPEQKVIIELYKARSNYVRNLRLSRGLKNNVLRRYVHEKKDVLNLLSTSTFPGEH